MNHSQTSFKLVFFIYEGSTTFKNTVFNNNATTATLDFNNNFQSTSSGPRVSAKQRREMRKAKKQQHQLPPLPCEKESRKPEKENTEETHVKREPDHETGSELGVDSDGCKNEQKTNQENPTQQQPKRGQKVFYCSEFSLSETLMDTIRNWSFMK